MKTSEITNFYLSYSYASVCDVYTDFPWHTSAKVLCEAQKVGKFNKLTENDLHLVSENVV